MLSKKIVVAIVLSGIFQPIYSIAAEEVQPSRILRTKFYFQDEASAPALDNLCATTEAKSFPILTDIAVSLAGKAAAGLVDLVANKAKAEAISMEAISPMEGFYGPKTVAASDGCLLIHNGIGADAQNASFKAILRLRLSEDQSAFRFEVLKWQFDSFFAPKSGSWFQDKTHKDFAFRIEFLVPGSESVGTRAIFIERTLANVTREDVARLYAVGDTTPWFRSPTISALPKQDRALPLNIKTSVIETSRPGQLGTWLAEAATSKKTDIVAAAESLVKGKLDEDYAATTGAKNVEAASAAYDTYKKEWDTVFDLKKTMPLIPNNPTPEQTAKFDSDTLAWQASMKARVAILATKLVLARSAYANASLAWPGDLPQL